MKDMNYSYKHFVYLYYMLSIRHFLINNATAITILSLIIFAMLVIFAFFNDTFKDVAPYDSDSKKGKVVTIESYEGATASVLPDLSASQAFCQTHKSRPHELDARCKMLSATACHIPSCCVLRNGTDCVAGNHRGPTFIDDKTHFFHFRGNCKDGRGKCPD